MTGSFGRRATAGFVALALAVAAGGSGLGLGLTANARAAGGGSGSAATVPSGVNPLGPVTGPSPTASNTATASTNTTATTAGGGGISSGSALAIAVAAFLIIVGIAFAILRDARGRIRKPRAAPQERVPGSKRPPKARKLSAAEKRRRKRGKAPRGR